MKPVPNRTVRIDTIPMVDQEIRRTIEIGIIPTIGIEATHIIEINDIKIIYHEITLTTDQIIKDLIKTTIKIDHAITHKIDIRTIAFLIRQRIYSQSPQRILDKELDKEFTLNHHIEISRVIQVLKTNIEAVHQNIKDK